MACHWCELSAAVLGFAGAALLSVDAIYGKQRVLQEEGKNAAREGAEEARRDLGRSTHKPTHRG